MCVFAGWTAIATRVLVPPSGQVFPLWKAWQRSCASCMAYASPSTGFVSSDSKVAVTENDRDTGPGRYGTTSAPWMSAPTLASRELHNCAYDQSLDRRQTTLALTLSESSGRSSCFRFMPDGVRGLKAAEWIAKLFILQESTSPFFHVTSFVTYRKE